MPVRRNNKEGPRFYRAAPLLVGRAGGSGPGHDWRRSRILQYFVRRQAKNAGRLLQP